MPEGEEKRRLGEWVEFQARRLREYRSILPMHWKVSSWGVISLVAALIITVVLFGAPNLFGPQGYWVDWILVAIVLLDLVWAVPLAFAGRTMAGWRPGYDAKWRAMQRVRPDGSIRPVGGLG